MTDKRKIRDCYSKAIRYFRDLYRRDPKIFMEAIDMAWALPLRKKGGCLFLWIARPENETEFSKLPERGFGCATQIRSFAVDEEYQQVFTSMIAATPELTKMIQNDTNIPIHPSKITVNSLKHFARYQRLADKAPKV